VGILPGKGDDQPFRLGDLAIDALLPVLGPVGRALADAKGASGSDVHCAMKRGKALRTPPARCAIGLGPGLENERSRGIEDAVNDEFGARRCRRRTGWCRHLSILLTLQLAQISRHAIQALLPEPAIPLEP